MEVFVLVRVGRVRRNEHTHVRAHTLKLTLIPAAASEVRLILEW